MTKFKLALPFLALAALFASCNINELTDVNQSIDDNNWAYAKSLKTTIEIKEPNQAYDLYFRLRHTVNYRYSNLFVIVHLKGNGLHKNTRYQFKLAKSDGEWLGQGSGDIYTQSFPLLTNYRFPKAGKYEIEIEQNMRDNPLVGISDVGLNVSKAQ